jgi:biopolymer transport protein ExbD
MAELNSSPQNNDGKKVRKKQSTRVDLTAMVDLAFLLVTFFMLTTTLSKPKAMDLAMPDKSTDQITDVSDKRTITLCLGNNNKVLMYVGLAQSPQVINYGKNGLRKALIEAKNTIKASTGKDAIVLVKPSDRSIYGNLVDALDELNITKTGIYAVVDISPQDIDLLKKRSVY